MSPEIFVGIRRYQKGRVLTGDGKPLKAEEDAKKLVRIYTAGLPCVQPLLFESDWIKQVLCLDRPCLQFGPSGPIFMKIRAGLRLQVSKT